MAIMARSPMTAWMAVDRKFQAAGHGKRQNIDGTINDQAIKILQGYRVVDDPLLHLKRYNPGEDNQDDNDQQDELQLQIAAEGPVQQRFFGHR